MKTVGCISCQWKGHWDYTKSGYVPLDNVPKLGERLEPGDTIPDGACPECGAFVYLIPDSERFAMVRWSWPDVQSHDPDISQEDAEEFLRRNERLIQGRLTEVGNEVIGIRIRCEKALGIYPKKG